MTDTTIFGTFDEETGEYTPRQVTSDDLGGMSFEDAISGTIVEFDDGDIVTGTVIEVVKGGLILDIGLRGFLPASLVELRRVRDLQPYVGRDLEAKIIELDKNRNNVVLSRRAWLEETQKEQREEFLANLKPGETRKGVVSSVVNFGAFVDLGGMDGLVHISEMSQHHVDLPEQVVTPGEELWVKIIDLDLQRRRISLSIKQAAEGGEVAEEYREHFGEHAYDEQGNYIGGETDPAVEQAWAEYYEQYPEARPTVEPAAAETASATPEAPQTPEATEAPEAPEAE